MATDARQRNVKNAVGATSACLRHLATMVEAAAAGDRACSEDLAHFMTGDRLGITIDAYLSEALGLDEYRRMIREE